MVSKRFALAALAGFVAIAAFACTTEKSSRSLSNVK